MMSIRFTSRFRAGGYASVQATHMPAATTDVISHRPTRFPKEALTARRWPQPSRNSRLSRTTDNASAGSS
jgi:hypothetical protein